MPRLEFTERAIARLPAPDPSGKQVLYWDAGGLKGFGVICSGTSNAKSFIVQRQVNGRGRRKAFAAVAEMSLAAAKKKAAEILVDLAAGIDPDLKAKASMTLCEALESYLTARRDLRPASVRSYRGVEHTLEPWMKWPLRQITADLVEKRHREIAAESGEVTANISMRTLRAVWNHAAVRVPDLPKNPTALLRQQWFKEQRRSRMLAEGEMPAFFQAVYSLPNPVARDFILLLLFTGLRKSEAAQLTWQHVNLQQRVITLPADITKAKRELALPMSDFVADMLIARRRLGRDRYVFPGKSGHISDMAGPFAAIAEQTGIKVSPHDLRRGLITIAESIGIPLNVIKALVNHAPARDTTSGYVIMATERLREPVRQIEQRLIELCGVETPAGGNVVKL
jgi:integrase